MELTTTIIGVALFLLAVVPLLIAIRLRDKKGQTLKKKFDALIASHSLLLAEQEKLNDKIVGVDAGNKKVLYVSHELPEGVVIDLKQVKGIKIIKTAENGQPAAKKELIAKMGLLFEYKDQQDSYLPFYDIETDDPLQIPYHNNNVSKWYNTIMESKKATALA